MDRLEQFFKKNRDGFDHLKADEAMFEGIMDKVQAPQSDVKGRPRTFPFRAIAAAIALLMIAGLGWFFSTQNNSPSQNPMAQLDIHQSFPEISLRDPYGEVVPLSSLKGKIVLVEFWASYSKVCTEEHCYFFKPLYDNYKEKGFEIYAVSIDSSATHWVDAIRKDSLDWVNVSDLEGNKTTFLPDIDPEELPLTFLLDENGRIIAKNIAAEELERTLSKLLAFNN